MKVRSDFVTNSSSSSFVSFFYQSKTLGDIINRFKKELKEQGLFSRGSRLLITQRDVLVSVEEEEGCVDDFPENVWEALSCLTRELSTEEALRISKNEAENEALDLTQFSDDSVGVRVAKEIFNYRHEILSDLCCAEVKQFNYGYGGDSDIRYYSDYYSEAYLKRLYAKIAKEKGVTVDDVTEDMFCDYVTDKTSVEESKFRWARGSNGRGRGRVTSKMYLED